MTTSGHEPQTAYGEISRKRAAYGDNADAPGAGRDRCVHSSRLHGEGTASYGRDCALLAFAQAPAVCDG